MLKAKVEISKTQLKTGVFRICIFTIKLIFEKFQYHNFINNKTIKRLKLELYR